MFRVIGALLGVLLLSGCGTSVHDMLYYPPIDDRAGNALPPVASETPPPVYKPAPAPVYSPPPAIARQAPPPVYAPPPAVARQEPPPVYVPPPAPAYSPPPAVARASAPPVYVPTPAPAYVPPPVVARASAPPRQAEPVFVAPAPATAAPAYSPPPPVEPPPVAANEPPQGATLPEGSERAVPVEEPIAPAPPRAESIAAAASARWDAHCKGVAEQRMQDGAMNGLDEDTQHAVYNGTYTDCMNWAQTHGE